MKEIKANSSFTHLFSLCQLTGYPGFFKLQQAHDELAHVRRMKIDELKQKASDVTGDDSGSKTELIVRITDAVLENAAT